MSQVDKAKKILDILFLVTMLLYVALAIVIVLGQSAAIISLNGALCLWFKEKFLIPACTVCSCTGLIAYVMSYVYHWDSGD